MNLLPRLIILFIAFVISKIGISRKELGDTESIDLEEFKNITSDTIHE